MVDYKNIEKYCEKLNEPAMQAIEHEVIIHAGLKDGLYPKFQDMLDKYGEVTEEMDLEVLELLNSMYIAKKVFGKDGLIHRYFEKNLFSEPKSREYLKLVSQQPWRWSYAKIVGNPRKYFFEMEDVFTQERYLLYSRGMQEGERHLDPIMWFNLIFFNGECYQTYGVLTMFESYDADDIYIFATEVDSTVQDDDDVVNIIDKNPLKFLLLNRFGQVPPAFESGFELRFLYRLETCDSFSFDHLTTDFRISRFQKYVELALLSHESDPHIAKAIYNERSKKLELMAHTREGYKQLVRTLHEHGFEYYEEPDFDIAGTMIIALQMILYKAPTFRESSMLLSKARDRGQLIQITPHPN